MHPHPLYPIFLRLEGRACVVVGGGRVAERKVRGLVASGAVVTVVARKAVAGIARLSRAKKIRLLNRPFSAGDLRGATIVICATDNPGLNRRVALEARRRGSLVNIADSPAESDFHLPSVVRRGMLQVAISTGGGSPALARRIREELERRYGPEYGELLRMAQSIRKTVLDRIPAGRRSAAFRAMTGQPIIALLCRGRRRAARCAMEEIIRKAGRAAQGAGTGRRRKGR